MNVNEIISKINAWNPETETSSILYLLITEFKENYPEEKLDDYVDITSFPVAEKYQNEVDKYSTYPIWTCDNSGFCLVGEAMDSVESIDEVIKTCEEF